MHGKPLSRSHHDRLRTCLGVIVHRWPCALCDTHHANDRTTRPLRRGWGTGEARVAISSLPLAFFFLFRFSSARPGEAQARSSGSTGKKFRFRAPHPRFFFIKLGTPSFLRQKCAKSISEKGAIICESFTRKPRRNELFWAFLERRGKTRES